MNSGWILGLLVFHFSLFIIGFWMIAGIWNRGERDFGSKNHGVAGMASLTFLTFLLKDKKLLRALTVTLRQETEVVETKASRGPHLTVDRAGMSHVASFLLRHS
jgi:hypothetical protein